jgi:hypothetical protein
MIRAVPKGWFSGEYFIQHDGATIGDLKISRSTLARIFERAPAMVFHLEGLDYELTAEVGSAALPFLGKLNRLVLKQDGTEIAWAVPSCLDCFFTVHWAGRQVDLKGRLWSWQRKIHLVEGGAEAGIISRGYFSRQTVCEPSGDVILAVQTFMLWLALWRWKSSARSSE